MHICPLTLTHTYKHTRKLHPCVQAHTDRHARAGRSCVLSRFGKAALR
uniref:Uncharacterized protein n=1 Tax=Anguilla anguilla TaxID=7936 RepID=A0A0E9TAV1_ANGAN